MWSPVAAGGAVKRQRNLFVNTRRPVGPTRRIKVFRVAAAE
jgi:hypothetical protein